MRLFTHQVVLLMVYIVQHLVVETLILAIMVLLQDLVMLYATSLLVALVVMLFLGQVTEWSGVATV